MAIHSHGIAKDLNMPIETVVDSKHVTENNMINAVKYALANVDQIRSILESEIPGYIRNTYEVKEVLKKAGTM